MFSGRVTASSRLCEVCLCCFVTVTFGCRFVMSTLPHAILPLHLFLSSGKLSRKSKFTLLYQIGYLRNYDTCQAFFMLRQILICFKRKLLLWRIHFIFYRSWTKQILLLACKRRTAALSRLRQNERASGQAVVWTKVSRFGCLLPRGLGVGFPSAFDRNRTAVSLAEMSSSQHF